MRVGTLFIMSMLAAALLTARIHGLDSKRSIRDNLLFCFLLVAGGGVLMGTGFSESESTSFLGRLFILAGMWTGIFSFLKHDANGDKES
ncbi:hypothetical protein [Paenibacillus humicus]|uniref:hypothetical protein n=1 Tax=Paenibacillus humicus TaxID=412861 RepID=UPI0013E2D5F8|nr:hypothetical protein [Paenibacillus humicus]